MKKKNLLSSGHGTGPAYVSALDTILKRERLRKYQKKRSRTIRLGERIDRWAKRSPKSSFVLNQRLQSLVQQFEHSKAVLNRLHAR